MTEPDPWSLLKAAKTYIDYFVPVEAAQVDGFDPEAWGEAVDAALAARSAARNSEGPDLTKRQREVIEETRRDMWAGLGPSSEAVEARLLAASKALIEADTIDMNCGWDDPSCHFCMVDTHNGLAHRDDCPWAAFKTAVEDAGR